MARATIKDVAKLSGYSITTVSMVVNNKNVSIPESTRKKIWSAVAALKYRPNQLAVGMITKKTKVLGLIIPDNNNLFFADLSKAIEMEAHKKGYSLLYGNTSNDPKRDQEYLKVFSDRRVDGIIFAKSSADCDHSEDQRTVEMVRECDIPLVTVDRQLPASGASSVMLNHFLGGYLATRHLIDLCHTRIGCYTGPLDLVNSNERLSGYRLALEEVNLPYDENLIYEGTYQMGTEEDAMYYFLNQRVSAVFAFNDLMAFGLYQVMKKSGLSIPKDLSIVGFDDVFVSEIIHPALTTIRQPIKRMAGCVVDILLQQIEDPKTVAEQQNYVFEPKLVLRDSTAKYNIKEGIS